MDNLHWIIIGTIGSTLPILLAKEYVLTNNKLLLIVALIIYVFLLSAYVNILKTGELSKTITLIKILQVVIIVLFGIGYYKEKITRNKLIGITAGIISIYFLCCV